MISIKNMNMAYVYMSNITKCHELITSCIKFQASVLGMLSELNSNYKCIDVIALIGCSYRFLEKY